MLREQHLIPFKTSDLPDGPYLIFSPHPDDETFAMGGTLLLAAKQGIKLHIVFITNGDLGGDPDVRQQEAKSVCEKLGASYEYLNYKDRTVGITKIAESINKINFTEGSMLLLENAAGKGCSLATTFHEIKEIYDQVDEKKQKYIGVCVDPAHICGYGDYDLSKCNEVVRMFEDFDMIIGLDKFTLLHLNDSVVPFGSRKDEHACLGSGQIWWESFNSLILLMDICKKHGIPAVLETHPLDMLKLAQISDSREGNI